MKLENIFVKEEFLRQVNLTILHGKFYFITGDETSNKLLSTIGLKEEIVLGNYYIGDINIAKLPNRKITLIRRKYFGFIFPNPLLENELTVLENLLLPLVFSHKTKTEKEAIAKKILKQLNLEKQINKYPAELTTLNKYKVSLARALINNPKVIIAENAIDLLGKEDALEMLKTLKNLCHDNMSVIITGNKETISPFADEFINVYKGVIKC